MERKLTPEESVKKYIRINIVNEDNSNDRFNSLREDGYFSQASGGFEELDLKEDIMKIQLYSSADVIEFNNGKTYKVIKRTFQAETPCMLTLNVKELV